MSSTFRRKIEDFACEHCEAAVTGDGFTNHCPKCLWSKHVDEYPGDREALCGGLMAPRAVRRAHGEEQVLHKCTRCGKEIWNRVQDDDDRDVLAKISAHESA